tara:strand:- start:3665 stop:4642 length:978 start_codon:yes stop_codon:yes gene_type:complete
MKLITYKINPEGNHLIGLVQNNIIYNLNNHLGDISIVDLIQIKNYQNIVKNLISDNNICTHELKKVIILPPIPSPNSLRDAYSFRKHVETSRMNRGKEMIPEFDQFPVFYFSNHNAIFGHKEKIELMPDHFQKLDYELEFAIVINKKGKNILKENAHKYIGGFLIMNDLSGRTLQMEEMKLNLGPAKGKDFATVIGPYLITPDELESKKIHTEYGSKYDLQMKCFINGKLLSSGNTIDMYWTFEEIIERVSYGVELMPGDIIGSGTVGTGCLLEINGTNKRINPEYIEKWINAGDEIKMQVDILGEITNEISKTNSNHSILKLKK